MEISQDIRDNIDTVLVYCVNFIMSAQMAASVLVFGKTIYLIVRNKMQTRVIPIETQSASEQAKFDKWGV